MVNEKYNYTLILDSSKVGAFLEVSGDDMTMEPIEYREGQMDIDNSLKRHGLFKYGNITLRNGEIYDTEFLDWILGCHNRMCERKTLRICFYDDGSNPMSDWEIVNAWPLQYEGIETEDETTHSTVQRIKFAHEGLKRS